MQTRLGLNLRLVLAAKTWSRSGVASAVFRTSGCQRPICRFPHCRRTGRLAHRTSTTTNGRRRTRRGRHGSRPAARRACVPRGSARRAPQVRRSRADPSRRHAAGSRLRARGRCRRRAGARASTVGGCSAPGRTRTVWRRTGSTGRTRGTMSASSSSSKIAIGRSTFLKLRRPRAWTWTPSSSAWRVASVRSTSRARATSATRDATFTAEPNQSSPRCTAVPVCMPTRTASARCRAPRSHAIRFASRAASVAFGTTTSSASPMALTSAASWSGSSVRIASQNSLAASAACSSPWASVSAVYPASVIVADRRRALHRAKCRRSGVGPQAGRPQCRDGPPTDRQASTQRRHASAQARMTASSPKASHALAQLPAAWAHPRA